MKNDMNEYYMKKIEKFRDSTDRIFERKPLPDHANKIHVSGVCGKAMGSVAGMLKEKGYEVSGSDVRCFPPISDMLERLEIAVTDFDENNVKDVDAVVVGNLCTPSHPEAKFSRENGIPQLSFPEVVNILFEGQSQIGVAGTHGKTTTSGLLSWVFERAGADPSYFVGGVIPETGKSFTFGNGKVAVLEADEYDTSYFDKRPKMLAYNLESVIVNEVEMDHTDIYDDFEDYKQAFRFLVGTLPENGLVVAWGDSDEVKALKKYSHAQFYTFGFGEDNDVVITDLETENGKQVFSAIIDEKVIPEIKTPMPGEYNVLNCTAVLIMALHYGLSLEQILQGIATFNGVKKRQEKIHEDDELLVFDDYAHHPTAVAQTIDGIRAMYPNKRIVALLENSSATSRTREFEDQFAEALSRADFVMVKEPPSKEGDNSENIFSAVRCAEKVAQKGVSADWFSTAEALVESLMETKEKGDLILFMASGSFGGAQEMFLEKLK